MSFLVNYPDPHSDQLIENAYAWAIETNFNFLTKTGRLVYAIYKSEQAATDGKKPIGQISIELTSTGKSITYGSPPLISPAQPAVYGDPPIIGYEDEEETIPIYGPPELITPSQPAVYGDPPILAPAIPSFDELVMANLTAYGLLSIAVDTLAQGQYHLFNVVSPD